MPSKLHKRCEKCKYKDDCDEKRMVACGYIHKPPLMAEMSVPSVMDLAQPIMAKPPELRNVWIDANTTIQIDLNDIAKQMEKDFYRSIGCHGFDFGT